MMKHRGGLDFRFQPRNWFLLILGVLPIWMVVLLARHLRRFPAGELCTRQKPANSKSPPGELDEGIPVDFDSVLLGSC